MEGMQTSAATLLAVLALQAGLAGVGWHWAENTEDDEQEPPRPTDFSGESFHLATTRASFVPLKLVFGVGAGVTTPTREGVTLDFDHTPKDGSVELLIGQVEVPAEDWLEVHLDGVRMTKLGPGKHRLHLLRRDQPAG